MRGFIINIRKAKNEDIIVTVLSNERVENYWRFFGARHSILQIGNLIDFEVEDSSNNFMPKMRNVSHLSFPWIFNPNHLLVWQNFIKLFQPHFDETSEIDPFYFEMLLASAQKWHKQNPKRLAVESYIKLLTHEGRLYESGFCYICEEILDEKVGLMRAYLPAHPHCVYAYPLDKKVLFTLFHTQSTIHIDDPDLQELYNILLKGF